MSDSHWPAHPQPFVDELFSSWMARAAVYNGENLSRFLKLTIPDLRSVTKSIDNFLSAQMMENVSKKMNSTVERVYQTTLDSYVGYACEIDTSRFHHKYNILNSGETRGLRYFQQYCPLCLSEGHSYYRKTWRISFVTVCCKHHCILEDRCPNCDSPVLVMNHKCREKKGLCAIPITACYNCLFDLREAKETPALEPVVEDTNKYLQALDNGYYKLNGSRWIYSFSLFLVLRHLIHLYALQNEQLSENQRVIDADTQTVRTRYAALSALAGIFNSWPDNFINYCQSTGITYSSITPIEKVNFGRVPFWLENEVKKHTYSRNQEPTIDSVLTAINIMRIKALRINTTTVNTFMGYRDSRVISVVLRKLRNAYE